MRTACGAAGRPAAPQHSWQPVCSSFAFQERPGPSRLFYKFGIPTHRAKQKKPQPRSWIQKPTLPALPPDQSKSFFSPSGEEKSKSITTLCSLNSENTSVSFTEDGLCTKQWKRNYFFERSFHQLTPLPSVEQQNCFSWSHPQQDLQQLNRDLGQIIPHHPSLQSNLILTKLNSKIALQNPQAL